MSRLAAAALLAFLAAAAVKTPTEAERIKALPEEERRWLTEYVAPIILPEERKAFLDLGEPYMRDAFKKDFWERREQDGLPRPLGPGYRVRYAELRRLADEKYDGWNQDAGRMVLRWGEPDSILSPHCAIEDVFFDLEVWYYANRTGPAAGRHIFYRPADLAPRRRWTVADELSESEKRSRGLRIRIFEPPFRPNSCRATMGSLAADCGEGTKGCNACPDLCEVYRAYLEIRNRQGSRAGAAMEEGMLFEAARISTEGIERQKDRWASTSKPGAKPIGAVPTPSPAPAAATTPEGPHALSDEEIRERILGLAPVYREWLEVAAPVLTREELERFLQMSTAEKDKFIREFWKKRK
jgi:GWxTD domain-containing protein